MKVPARTELRSFAVRAREWIGQNELLLVLCSLMALLVLTFFWSSIVIAIKPGEAGVLWSRFSGTKTDRVYPEGLHLILPWNVMTIYNVRYQTNERSFLVLSRDGLEIGVDVAVRFKPIDKLVPKLHQQVGPGYIDTIVAPEVNTAVRTVIGRFRPDELYAASFGEIQNDIVTLARRRVRNRFVLIDDILVKTIILPASVSAAIQRKLEQEQMALEMQYRLSRERQEADRKRIEAAGIRDYQVTVDASLSARLLQFKSIEAAFELAKSNNAKIVVLGGGGAGMPIILNPDSLSSQIPQIPPSAGAVAVPRTPGPPTGLPGTPPAPPRPNGGEPPPSPQPVPGQVPNGGGRGR